MELFGRELERMLAIGQASRLKGARHCSRLIGQASRLKKCQALFSSDSGTTLGRL
jgi:hypothetical protein